MGSVETGKKGEFFSGVSVTSGPLIVYPSMTVKLEKDAYRNFFEGVTATPG